MSHGILFAGLRDINTTGLLGPDTTKDVSSKRPSSYLAQRHSLRGTTRIKWVTHTVQSVVLMLRPDCVSESKFTLRSITTWSVLFFVHYFLTGLSPSSPTFNPTKSLLEYCSRPLVWCAGLSYNKFVWHCISRVYLWLPARSELRYNEFPTLERCLSHEWIVMSYVGRLSVFFTICRFYWITF